MRTASASIPRAASKLRQARGLAPLSGTVTEFTGKLPLYLIPATPEFDGNRGDLPPSAHYVGPCLWDKDPNQASPEWIGRVPRDRPCVIVSEGTIYPEKPLLLRMAARGLANLPLNVWRNLLR
jgi:UDP:flavonoid glycosyltransferase YjiC (YdhE family)